MVEKRNLVYYPAWMFKPLPDGPMILHDVPDPKDRPDEWWNLPFFKGGWWALKLPYNAG
jgi:hypothetical protein